MKKKKGFTLVELLVVIAILAVLATVSVVGYMGFTKKAHESNDASLTAQMNTALQANGVVKKNKTLTEAREDLLEAGIDLEKVTPTTDGYSYVWDSKQDLMFLLNGERQVVAPTNVTISENTVDSFVVVHNEAEYNTWKGLNYSLYFANGYESQTVTLDKLVGIDAGTSGINDISVKDDTSTADVTMYTTSGTLTIDAGQATVRHYGEVKTVSIKAIAGESYHEYGTVTGNVEVTKGRVELENTADVNTVLVSSEKSGDSKVDYNSGAKVGTVAPTTDAAKEDVSSSTIPNESKQATVVDKTETNKFAGGLGTEKSPYLIENLTQLKKLNSLKYDSKSESIYVKQIANIKIEGNALDFKNGNGDYSVIYKFKGRYDGNGFNILNNVEVTGATTWHSFVYYPYGNVEITNLNVYLGKTWFNLISDCTYCTSLNFENINFYNQNNTVFEVAGNNFGLLVSYTMHSKLYAKNINNYANINNSEYASGLFIGGWYLTKDTIFDNCNNYATWNGPCGFFNGNIAYIKDKTYSKLVVKDCHNYGTVVGSKVNLLGVSIIESTCKKEIELRNTNNFSGLFKMDSTTGLLSKNNDNKIIINEVEGATKYVLTMYVHYSGKNSINGGFVLTKTFEKNGDTNFHSVKFIDSITATTNTTLGITNYKNGTKYHDDINNLDYYYISVDNNYYYVFENPKTALNEDIVLNGFPRCTLMVYNESQLIAYENVNANNIK